MHSMLIRDSQLSLYIRKVKPVRGVVTDVQSGLSASELGEGEVHR
jgi:hypothetical protein